MQYTNFTNEHLFTTIITIIIRSVIQALVVDQLHSHSIKNKLGLYCKYKLGLYQQEARQGHIRILVHGFIALYTWFDTTSNIVNPCNIYFFRNGLDQ